MKDVNLQIRELNNSESDKLRVTHVEIHCNQTVKSHGKEYLGSSQKKAPHYVHGILHKTISLFLRRNFGGQKAVG